MTNGDKIRSMTDEQLVRFLWTFKINSMMIFFTDGQGMDAKDLDDWIKSTEFVCRDTEVGEDFIYDQDFNLKETSA